MPPADSRGISRRTALVGAAGAVAAGVLPGASAAAAPSPPTHLPAPGSRQVAFVLSHEQFPGRRLVQNAQLAERAGFDGIWTSDHIQPWEDLQGHSSYPWDTLARIGEDTSRIFLGPGVTCPIYRHRPTEVAQFFATLARDNPGRVFLAVGTGEALNEKASTGQFGRYRERADRLVEAVTLIRRLWTGDKVSFDGRYYQTVSFRLWDLPTRPVPLYIAASGPQSAYLAGRYGDGWVTGAKEFTTMPELHAQFRRGARDAGRDPEAMPKLVETFVSTGTLQATEKAAELWRFTADAYDSDLLYDPDPASIRRKATAKFTLPQVYGGWLRGTDPAPHVKGIRDLLAAGATPFVHSGQADQAGVIEFYRTKVLPAVR